MRPNIDWDKGKAVQWILGALKFDTNKNSVIYIGDDTTDEDAFEAIKDQGIGICVMNQNRPTKAQYSVSETEDVKAVLSYLIER